MRNLKRALSLALAFVMVMSLMIVGTSAKSYTDADKIDNQVAVEILGEIGVMIGNDDGSFAPDRDVTRAEMAVIHAGHMSDMDAGDKGVCGGRRSGYHCSALCHSAGGIYRNCDL